MNPINLLLPNGTPSHVWACSKCNLVRQSRAVAEACCTRVVCKVCGGDTEKFHAAWVVTGATCDDCRTVEADRQDRERMAKATKLDDWDGWVWTEGHGGNNGYFEHIEAYVEFLECDRKSEDEWPEYVYVAEAEPFVGVDLGRVLENLCEDLYEDAQDSLVGVEELQKAVDEFNMANAHVVTYHGDYGRAVRVPRPEGG